MITNHRQTLGTVRKSHMTFTVAFGFGVISKKWCTPPSTHILHEVLTNALF